MYVLYVNKTTVLYLKDCADTEWFILSAEGNMFTYTK